MRFKSNKVGTIDVAKHAGHRSAPQPDPYAEFRDEDGGIGAAALANSMRMIRSDGPRRAAAAQASRSSRQQAQASRPPRQQTLDDFEFSLGSKETLRSALISLSADEIDSMFRAMDRGDGVDVRSGRNRLALDILRMKRARESGQPIDESGALLPRRGARESAAEELLDP